MINKAIIFATNAHKNQLRKGTDLPYIIHPIEVASIVARLTNDKEIIVAALLHDVIEDTNKTYEDILNEFGERVAKLVSHESEDKTKSWKERKEHTINQLKIASFEVQIIALGDKLSNIRSLIKDYEILGDKVWQRFNVKNKALHAWYYRNLVESLKSLSNFREYKEFQNLVYQLFGNVFLYN